MKKEAMGAQSKSPHSEDQDTLPGVGNCSLGTKQGKNYLLCEYRRVAVQDG